MRIFISLSLLIGLSTGITLVPPFDEGVVIKIRETVVQDLANELVDKAVTHLKSLTLSDSIKDGKLTINYWDLEFSWLTMTPTVNLRKEPGKDKLVVEAEISGDIMVSSRWRVIRKSWYGSVSFSGGMELNMDGFSVRSRVLVGEISDSGYLGFQHDPDFCKFDAGSLDIHFTGRTGWIINIFLSLFESELRKLVEQYVCLTINEEIDKVSDDLNTAVFDRYDEFDMKGHTVQINNRPSIVTGGEECAIIGALGQITLPDPDQEPDVTDPFIDPTAHPNKLMTTTYPTSSTVTSSSTTTPILVRRRRGVDLCSELPGSGSQVAIVVTEDMISRLAFSLHYLNLVNYKAVQGSGVTQIFEQYWGGEKVEDVNIPTRRHTLLKDYNVSFKITSTSPPSVSINEVGVAVSAPLRARVTLNSGGLEIRVELHTAVSLLGRCNLALADGVYRIVPVFTTGADVTAGRIQVAGLAGGAQISKTMLSEIEEQLNMLLGIGLPALVKRELENGFPINIPGDHVTIGDADIDYRNGYILVTVNDVQINL